MRQRGRKSAASMEVQPALSVLEVRRPSPPLGLTEVEAAIWHDVVACHPAGWFNKAQFPLLKAYCRHAGRAEMLAGQISGFQPEWLAAEGGLERFDALLRMAERESRAMSSLATRMRITHQAQRDPNTAGRAVRNEPSGPFPWEDDFLSRKRAEAE
jgi:hypothetical protein